MLSLRVAARSPIRRTFSDFFANLLDCLLGIQNGLGCGVDFVPDSDPTVGGLRIGDSYRRPSPPDSFPDRDQIATEPTAARQPSQCSIASIEVNEDMHRPLRPGNAALKCTLSRPDSAAARPLDDFAQNLVDHARAGGWRPVSALRAVSRDGRVGVNGACRSSL